MISSARCGEATGVIDVELAADGALGFEVGELLDLNPKPLLERGLRPDRVTGDAVKRRSMLGELVAKLVVQVQLVCADRAERERVEDENRRLAHQIGFGKRTVARPFEAERRYGSTGREWAHLRRPSSLTNAR